MPALFSSMLKFQKEKPAENFRRLFPYEKTVKECRFFLKDVYAFIFAFFNHFFRPD